MRRRGEAFFTKIGISIALLIMATTFGLAFMTDLASNYGRTIEDQYSDGFDQDQDLRALQIEAQQIQKNSGIDSQSSDIAQVQGILSVGEKQAESQTILTSVLEKLQEIIPFDSYVLKAILAIIAIVMLGAIVYVVIGRWI